MRNGKINVLNALAIRKVNFPAHHFTFISLDKFNPTYVLKLDEWIFEHLNGRYYIGPSLGLYNNNIVYLTKVGFEFEKEVSFFKIACPYI